MTQLPSGVFPVTASAPELCASISLLIAGLLPLIAKGCGPPS
jgi:hypothetical protein